MTKDNERKLLDSEIRTLRAEIYSAGTHLGWDSAVRALYAKEISAMAQELAKQMDSGALTPIEAAKQAQESRNNILKILRRGSTPVGRAIAENIKREGMGLQDLIIKNFSKIHNGIRINPRLISETERNRLLRNFEKLPVEGKNQVYAAIVESAGRPRDLVVAGIEMKTRGKIGGGLLILSVGWSIYVIATAEDKAQAAKRELAVTGAGIGGAILGGAAAGLVCGPAAPVCSTAGAFIGGALAAFGVSWFW